MTLKVQITKEEISSPKQKSKTDTPNHLKQNKTKQKRQQQQQQNTIEQLRQVSFTHLPYLRGRNISMIHKRSFKKYIIINAEHLKKCLS